MGVWIWVLVSGFVWGFGVEALRHPHTERIAGELAEKCFFLVSRFLGFCLLL